MGFNCGIVGLPNVGKSTIFNALTNGKAESANYPFCTIDPNKGIVAVPDVRLQKISEFIVPQKQVPTTIEFVDIAGLVKGASQGEGLGNQFLGNIRSVDAIAHVIRCFDDPDVVHVHGTVDPLRDIEVIQTELILADLDSIKKRQDKLVKIAKSGDKTVAVQSEVLQKLDTGLNAFKLARQLGLTPEEEMLVSDLQLLTLKPYFYVCNVDEAGLKADAASYLQMVALAKTQNVGITKICGKFEAELSELTGEERQAFLEDMGLKESGLESLARVGYQVLNLITYFTAGEKEVRAWTVHQGWLAPQAAGVIHSDFERGFIKAEVYHCNDLFQHKTIAKVREAGLLRMEGKEYVVKDGDVMLFKFNV